MDIHIRFNGAALFQVRKGIAQSIGLSAPNELQWGRTFSSAESVSNHRRFTRNPLLQWGRTFSSAESDAIDEAAIMDYTLQWGRTFSSAESR